MTPEERAEKIIDYVESNLSHDARVTSEWVCAQIREAEKEAILEEGRKVKDLLRRIDIDEFKRSNFIAGRASMREEAAKVADDHWCTKDCDVDIKGGGCNADIAERIRAIGVEGK